MFNNQSYSILNLPSPPQTSHILPYLYRTLPPTVPLPYRTLLCMASLSIAVSTHPTVPSPPHTNTRNVSK